MRDRLVPSSAPALILLLLTGCATAPVGQNPAGSSVAETRSRKAVDERVAYYAEVYGVPESLIHRSIERESGYDPRQHAGPYWGLMQIRYDTARGMGYRGPPRGLLDVDANLKYSVAYLANAYLVAGGDADRALRLYAGGYFYEARRKHLLDRLRTADGAPTLEQASSAQP
jgi:soluble lytic murein transglycosylase-like protein